MLAHEPADIETTTLPNIMSDTLLTTAVETVDAQESFEDLLEDSVDQAIAPLIGTVPRADRLTRRAALRAELDTLVAAHRELEIVPERAVSEALAHFARLHPASLQRGALQTHVISQNTVKKSLTQSILTKLSPAYPAMLLALGVLTPFYLLDASGAAGHLWHGESWMLYRLEALAVPLIGGLIVGLLNRRHAVRGTLMANALLAIPAVLFPSLLLTLSILIPQIEPNQFFKTLFYFVSWFGNLAPGIVGLTCWPLLSGLGAKAGGHLSSFFWPSSPILPDTE